MVNFLFVWLLCILTNFSSSSSDSKLGSNERYWSKCKLYQVWVDLEDLSFQTIFSITLRFHDCLASILTNFSSSPNESKLGSNERYWSKCKLYQVWVDLEDLSFQTIFSITLRFHDCLASILTNFSLSPNDSKLGSNERYWCKSK